MKREPYTTSAWPSKIGATTALISEGSYSRSASLHDHHVTARSGKAGLERGGLAHIARLVNDAHARVLPGEIVGNSRCFIPGTVVDQDEFAKILDPVEDGPNGLPQGRLFVVGGHHH
jgi:hypothetical protein